MVTINDVFVCDEFQVGQFNKFNILGWNYSRTLTVDALPYELRSYLLVLGEIDQKSFSGLSIQATLYDSSEKILEKKVLLAREGTSPETEVFPLPLIIPYKFNLTILSYGSIEISVFIEGKLAYTKKFSIEEGESPNTKLANHPSHSKLFHGDNPQDLEFLKSLIGSASKKLLVIDSYAYPKEILFLLGKVGPEVEITLLTYDSRKKDFKEDKDLKINFPNLKTWFSKKDFKQSHDRFIVINGTEYYHFGSSLKDLVNKKISICTKIIDLKILIEFNDAIKEILSNSTN